MTSILITRRRMGLRVFFDTLFSSSWILDEDDDNNEPEASGDADKRRMNRSDLLRLFNNFRPFSSHFFYFFVSPDLMVSNCKDRTFVHVTWQDWIDRTGRSDVELILLSKHLYMVSTSFRVAVPVFEWKWIWLRSEKVIQNSNNNTYPIEHTPQNKHETKSDRFDSHQLWWETKWLHEDDDVVRMVIWRDSRILWTVLWLPMYHVCLQEEDRIAAWSEFLFSPCSQHDRDPTNLEMHKLNVPQTYEIWMTTPRMRSSSFSCEFHVESAILGIKDSFNFEGHRSSAFWGDFTLGIVGSL